MTDQPTAREETPVGLAAPDMVRLKFPERHLPYADDVPILVDRILAATLPRETCLACGCLCKPVERCPGCMSNAVTVERLLAEGTVPDAAP